MNYDDLISIPFLDGGRNPAVGLDCWGLVREVYRRYGVNLPDYPISAMDAKKIGEQMAQDKPDWIEINGPMHTPCLVVIRLACGSWANHVGVYIGDGQFIHAYRTTGVAVDKIKKWRSSIVGFYIPRG